VITATADILQRSPADALREPLAHLFGPAVRATPFMPPSGVADETLKLLVHDAAGRKIAVVLVASPAAPHMVAHAMANARQAKQWLGDTLGRVVLEPLAEGDTMNLTWAALPYCLPAYESPWRWRWHRRWMRPAAFAWLRQVAKRTVADRAPADAERALRFVTQLSDMPTAVRDDARRALDALGDTFIPRAVLMHNDLWLGNCLIDPRRTGDERLTVIDWCGLCRDGAAMFDVVRLARSMALPGDALRDELLAHCDIVGCDPKHARDYLLIAIGRIGLYRDHLPMNLYLSMANWTLQKLDSVPGFER